MNIEPQELRREILLQLYTARPIPITTLTIYQMVRRAVYGAVVTQTAIERELDFLKGGGHVEDSFTIANTQVWKITNPGATEYERCRV